MFGFYNLFKPEAVPVRRNVEKRASIRYSKADVPMEIAQYVTDILAAARQKVDEKDKVAGKARRHTTKV